MSRRRPGDISGEFGRRNLSKMAITMNIEIRIAVATNPKETAFTELSNWIQLTSDLSKLMKEEDMLHIFHLC